MAFWVALPLACLLTAFAVWLTCGTLARRLRAGGILDRPGDRSSHSTPTPRGGGLALLPAVLLGWLAWDWFAGPQASPPGFWPVLLGVLLLAGVSWLDDLRSLPAAPRLFAQALAVALGLYGLGTENALFAGWLPLWLDLMLSGLAWLWFVNLFNFMDGIDGIAGVETASVGLGLALLAALAGWPAGWIVLPALLAAAALGFLGRNWAPARLFLGDVGSVSLGYLLGWLLLATAGQPGGWAAAAILPAYYLADASLTLLRRLARREAVWRAHRSHFYQRAVQGGLGHGAVAARIGGLNLGLIALALLAWSGAPWLALGLAALAVAALLWHFAAIGRSR